MLIPKLGEKLEHQDRASPGRVSAASATLPYQITSRPHHNDTGKDWGAFLDGEVNARNARHRASPGFGRDGLESRFFELAACLSKRFVHFHSRVPFLPKQIRLLLRFHSSDADR
jgi:hypothetical protein